MKTLALTIQFEDSVELRAARQLVEGAMSTIAGFRACKASTPHEYMPIKGSVGADSALLVRMDFLCSKHALASHGMTLSQIADNGGLQASEAVALNLRIPYRRLATADALQALLMSTKPLPIEGA